MVYAAAEELEKNLKRLVGRAKKVAMQYSPKNQIPYISLVDAGTVELIRAQGCKVVSSADLVQQFEAAWTPQQLESHRVAGREIDRITQTAFAEAARRIRSNEAFTEYDLQQWIMGQFRASGVTSDSPPIVAVGPHAGDPHYEPKERGSAQVREGDLLLLDIWGKTLAPNSVYYDITPGPDIGRQGAGKVCENFPHRAGCTRRGSRFRAQWCEGRARHRGLAGGSRGA